MTNTLKVQNFFFTNVTSESIPSSGAFTFNVATAPSYQNGFLVISAENTLQREIVYFHSVSGNTVSVRAENRGLGGTSAKEHTQGETITMRDVAEIFNFYADAVSTCFFVEKTGGLNVKVWGGTVYYNAAPQEVADTNIVLTDNTTNYIKYDFATNTISTSTVNSGNVKAIAVVLSGVIVSIAYKTAKETFIDYTVTINDALPSQTGNSGKSLVTDGTNASWTIPSANGILPSQTSNSGKSLTTDGTNSSWQQIIPVQTGNAGKVLGTDGTTASWGAGAIASTTIAGAVEIATDAEFDAGTTTGGTGASLVGTTLQSTRKIPINSGSDGTDGALSISSGTTTLTATNGYVEKFYTNLTLSGSATLNFSGKTSNGLVAIINVSGDFTMSGGTIDISGQGGNAETAGMGFLYGQTIGTAPTGQTGGVGIPLPIGFLAYKYCGSGGAVITTGAAGIGGGVLIIRVKGTVNFTGGTITAAGLAGTLGAGGGGGGMVIIMGGTITANSGTINVNGGAGGIGGTSNETGGGGGLSISSGGLGGAVLGIGTAGSSNTYGSGGTAGLAGPNGGGGGGGGAGFKYVGKHLI